MCLDRRSNTVVDENPGHCFGNLRCLVVGDTSPELMDRLVVEIIMNRNAVYNVSTASVVKAVP